MDDIKIGEILLPGEESEQERREKRVKRRFWPTFRRAARQIPFSRDLVAAYYCAIDPKTPTRTRGILLAARLGRGDIASGNNLLLDAVAAALIGFAVLGAAKPNAFGTAIGALFVGILLQGLTMMNAPYYTQDFIKGAVLVAALIFTFALSKRGKR